MHSNSETDRLLQVKSALMQTTSTRGWLVIKQIVDNVVAKAKQDAIDEEDAAKGEKLRLKAKAMQDGLRDLFSAIEVAKQFDSPEEPAWFAQLAFEESANEF